MGNFTSLCGVRARHEELRSTDMTRQEAQADVADIILQPCVCVCACVI